MDRVELDLRKTYHFDASLYEMNFLRTIIRFILAERDHLLVILKKKRKVLIIKIIHQKVFNKNTYALIIPR